MKKTIAFAVTAVVIIGIIFFINKPPGEKTGSNLYPADEMDHAHGLAVAADSSKVYLATHRGLYALINDKELYRVGKNLDDYMGFSLHPTDPNVMFTSGHPMRGGNFGIRKTVDGGITWEQISDGVNGPVDFHAMAVSKANPDIMYGWYDNGLQRSLDGGETWAILDTDIVGVLSLATHPTNEAIVYAATPLGLKISKDKGVTWEVLGNAFQDSFVLSPAINPKNPSEMLVYSKKLGVAKSTDDGKTWQAINEGFGGSMVFFIAYDQNNPNVVYANTKENALYKSVDGGGMWSLILEKR